MTLAFWHPVGAHAGESFDDIANRKRQEVLQYGYTLWSFAPAHIERVAQWRNEISGQECTVIGTGINSVDPGVTPYWAVESSEDKIQWKKIPQITSYHKKIGKNGIMASAFVVSDIKAPDNVFIKRPNNWFKSAEGRWESGSFVPTRGQYLIKDPEFGVVGIMVRVILKVKFPYVVWLR